MRSSIKILIFLYFSTFFSSWLNAADAPGRWQHDKYEQIQSRNRRVSSTRDRNEVIAPEIVQLKRAADFGIFINEFNNIDLKIFGKKENLRELVNIMSVALELKKHSLKSMDTYFIGKMSFLYGNFFLRMNADGRRLLNCASQFGLVFNNQTQDAIRGYLIEKLAQKKYDADKIIDFVHHLYLLNISLEHELNELINDFIKNIKPENLNNKNIKNLLRICSHYRLENYLNINLFNCDKLINMSYNNSNIYNMLNSLSIMILNKRHKYDTKALMIIDFMKKLASKLSVQPQNLIEYRNCRFFISTWKALTDEPLPNRVLDDVSPDYGYFQDSATITGSNWQWCINLLQHIYPQLEAEKDIPVTCSPVDAYLEIVNKDVSKKIADLKLLLSEQDLEDGEIISEKQDKERQNIRKDINQNIDRLEHKKNFKIIIQFDGKSHFLFENDKIVRENGSTSAQTELFKMYKYKVYRISFDKAEESFNNLLDKLKSI